MAICPSIAHISYIISTLLVQVAGSVTDFVKYDKENPGVKSTMLKLWVLYIAM